MQKTLWSVSSGFPLPNHTFTAPFHRFTAQSFSLANKPNNLLTNEERPMNTSELPRYKTPLLVLSVVLLVWGASGVLDVRNQTYTGHVTDGNNTITGVSEGGPAEAAGLQAGDYIRSIGGTAVEDMGAVLRQSRAEINEVRTFEVERDGETLSLDVTYVALPLNNALVLYGGILVGVLFLVFGVWAFLTVQSSTTALLAVLGITFSPGLMAGPYFASASVRTAVGVVILLLIIVGFAVLTHFLLVFPKPKRMLERRKMTWAVYSPAVVVGLLAVWFLVAQPAATSAVNVFFRALFGLFVVAYFGTSLIALIHSYVKTPSQDRAVSGLNLLLIGAVVGLGPSLVISIVGLIAPQIVVPGAQFLPLGIGLLPVTFALAAVRKERSTQAA
jgi:membrane-associated protease RseP (regulator of RpoE activity)